MKIVISGSTERLIEELTDLLSAVKDGGAETNYEQNSLRSDAERLEIIYEVYEDNKEDNEDDARLLWSKID